MSGIPFLGPIGGARVGYIDGKYVLNPRQDELPNRASSTSSSPARSEGVLMVESEAKELSEDVMLGAVMFGHEQFQPVIQAIIELAEACAKEPWDLPPPSPEAEAVEAKLRAAIAGDLAAAYAEQQKQARSDQLDAVKAKVGETFPEEPPKADCAGKMFKELEKDIVRGAILETRQAHRRPRHQDRPPDRRPRSASCRAPTARRSSPAARPRRSW